jgi:creatinine amidohydrolase
VTPTTTDYAALRPDQLAERIAAVPVAFVPWGALEWHSFHLPVGLDGFTAEGIARRAAARTGGLLLPTMYLPITTLPHRFSVSFRATTVRAVLDDLLTELARVGFRVVVILSGHYAQGHELVLMDAAQAAMKQHGMQVLALPPLALLGDACLDHAGRWETAQLLALQPELVDLPRFKKALADDPTAPVARFGVLGELPTTATAEDGEAAVTQAADALNDWVQRLLESDDPQLLHDLYTRRHAAYQSFIERYFHGSYEDAAVKWWDERITEH